jgi:EAL domain-containing protein (putative c-di-GMP-specific phosphodiesterase class I)
MEREIWHNNIDKQQKKINQLNNQGRISADTTVGLHIMDALGRGVDDLQMQIEMDSTLKSMEKIKYLRSTELLLQGYVNYLNRRDFPASVAPTLIKAFAQCIELDKQQKSFAGIIENNEYGVAKVLVDCLKEYMYANPGMASARSILMRKYLTLHPEQIMPELAKNISAHSNADSLIKVVDRGIDFKSVAVNASAAEFRSDDFAERVLEQLRAAKIPTHCFQLEVTETVFLGRGAENVHRALSMLDAHGVRIALDDFGTGYASLRHLKQFPVDIIKIDQSFVRDMADDPGDEAIIRAVINLGRSLGIKVVAEGIESDDQERRLLELDCDFGQGFLYSRAVPASRVPALVERWRGHRHTAARDLRLVANRA